MADSDSFSGTALLVLVLAGGAWGWNSCGDKPPDRLDLVDGRAASNARRLNELESELRSVQEENANLKKRLQDAESEIDSLEWSVSSLRDRRRR